MELKYTDWLSLREMSGITADIGEISLQKTANGYEFSFDINGKDYLLEFSGPKVWKIWDDDSSNSVKLAERRFSIIFQVGGSMRMPRDTMRPTEVYNAVFKGVRKLLEEGFPDALSFYGAYHEQDVMYDKFYNKYLHKAFTRVGSENYLRNDLYNKYKEADGSEWKAIVSLDKEEGHIVKSRVAMGNSARIQARQDRLAAQKRQRDSEAHSTAPQTPWHGISGASQSPNHPQGPQRWRRGDRTPTGGIFVGTSPNGVDYIAHYDNDYERMVQAFDASYPELAPAESPSRPSEIW